MRVAALMQTEVIVTTPDATLREVDELFTLNSISGAPVVENGQLLGVISQTDVIRVLYDGQEAATEVSQYFLSPFPIPMPSIQAITAQRSRIVEELVSLPASAAMSVVPIVVSPEDHVRDAAQKMIDALVHRVLVTNDGQLVGVLSALDLARLVATDF